MLTRSHFSVDLWFIFGSFCYGAEASLAVCHKDALVLQVTPTSQSALSELLSFFDSINEKAKSLIRTEVRIFVNSNPNAAATDWADELVTTLMTEWKPRVLALPENNQSSAPPCLKIELLDLRGLTPNDQDTWDNLVGDIWPRLPL